MLQYFIVTILFTHMHIHFAHASDSGCIELEREALMEFKGSLIDKNNRLSSWTGSDCCSWDGITCHNFTGHVHVIDLNSYNSCSECFLAGRINPSLLKLEHLGYLDLSLNDFEGLPIPSFLGSFRHLQYLNLKHTGFSGEIPQQLGNLSNLQHLSLGGDYSYPTSSTASFSVRSLIWITGLSSLQSLELRYTNLSDSVDWFHSLNKLSSLSSLLLQSCELPAMARSDVSYTNLTSLLSLQFYETNLGFTLPPWLFNLTGIEDLTLSGSGLHGPIPNRFEKLTNLVTLDLSLPSVGSPFPHSLCSLTRLTHMFIDGVNLQGSLPSCLSNLTSLTYLVMGRNELNDEIPSELGNLTQLTTLDLSYNRFSSTIPSNFGHLQKLIYLDLKDNQLTGKFPLTLGNLTNLQSLDVSKNFLTGELSESSLVGVRSLQDLIISRNPFLFLNVSSQWIPPFQIERFEMDSVIMDNQFPHWLQTQRNLNILVMSNANITGNIPHELCKSKDLWILSLANNQLTGRIPSCLGNLLQLRVLDLENNKLSGHIPREIGSLEYLGLLHLNGNKLLGELPVSLQNLTSLLTLDLGENEFQGCMPEWIGKEFSRLEHLRLESNNFSCEISVNLCQLPSLHILNLAHNNLVGMIPPCLGSFRRMSEYAPNDGTFYGEYSDTLLNDIKGAELEYSSSILPYAKFISLSGNHLHGEIPEELMNLTGLQSLNMSSNDLSGRIPERIGNLKHLESLDLSMNQIYGTVPQSLARIDSLSYLNLSFNKLEGKIPSGNHFDTLIHPSTFEGNIGLCGKLLERRCPNDDDSGQSSKENGLASDDDNGEFERAWLYAGTGPGFGVGFLGVILVLYFNKAWRYAYFRFLDNACDRVWITFAIKIPVFTRKFK